MLQQPELSAIASSRFPEIFPGLLLYALDDFKDVIFMTLASPHEKLKILISTRETRLTVGFYASPSQFYWHEHIPADQPIDDQIKKACDIINDIISGRTGIVYSSHPLLGYMPAAFEDLDSFKKHQQPDEVIEFHHWQDL